MVKISVLIPVYNRAGYIASAIDSILTQRGAPPFELLIVDDGSTDDSIDRVHTFGDPRIRVVRNERNLGIAATRNRGIKAAKGEYVAFLDSDDFALPDRLARQAAFLDKNARYAAVGAWIAWIDEGGGRIKRVKRKPAGPRQIAAQRLFRSGLENSTVMARTAVLRDYPHREDLVLGSDYDLWARIASDHDLATLPAVLVWRRQHASRATTAYAADDKKYRCRIFAWQLQELGVAYSAADLERHFLLRRLSKADFAPDRQYLDWAEHWLLKLRSANARKHCYPEPAFSGVLGLLWLNACWHGNRAAGGWPWIMFWRSPLRRASVFGAGVAIGDRVNAALRRKPCASGLR